MNKEKKTLLNIQLLLQYYKNDNILDRYHRIIENGIVFDNEILDEIQPNIYVVKYNKYIKLKKEINRLNNIINELEEYLNQEIIEWQDVSDLWTKAQVQEDRIVLDKLKELKENK